MLVRVYMAMVAITDYIIFNFTHYSFDIFALLILIFV